MILRCNRRADRPGPIARVSPEHLITSDPDLWAYINGVRSPYRRAPWYYHAARFEPGKDNVFTECDNERHDARRKKMYAGVCTDLKGKYRMRADERSTLVKKIQPWSRRSMVMCRSLSNSSRLTQLRLRRRNLSSQWTSLRKSPSLLWMSSAILVSELPSATSCPIRMSTIT